MSGQSKHEARLASWYNKKPAPSTKEFEDWESENYKLMLQLFNSMEPDIYAQFMFHDYVNELWADLTGFYSHSGNKTNKTRVFELHQDISRAS